MSESKLPRERAIIVVGMGGVSGFLAIEGETITSYCENLTYTPEEAGIDCYENSPGIYYFEARPEYVPETWESSIPSELEWQEVSFRKATLEDLSNMGINIGDLLKHQRITGIS